MEKGIEKFHLADEPLGRGVERTVYPSIKHPDRVVGIYHEGSEETSRSMKATYYLTKIAHLLFPANIPDVQFAASDPNAVGRTRVELGEEHETLKKQLDSNHSRTDEFTDQVRKASRKLSYGKSKKVTKFVRTLYEAGVNPDRSAYNFGLDEEGNIIYVEPFPAFYFNSSKRRWQLAFSPEKLKAAIAKLENGDMRGSASRHLERIFRLFAEAKDDLAHDISQ